MLGPGLLSYAVSAPCAVVTGTHLPLSEARSSWWRGGSLYTKDLEMSVLNPQELSKKVFGLRSGRVLCRDLLLTQFCNYSEINKLKFLI